jgi:HIRAN domain
MKSYKFVDSLLLGFLPREIAKWVSPLSDSAFLSFSAFIHPKETLEAAYAGANTKVQLFLYLSKARHMLILFNLHYFYFLTSHFRVCLLTLIYFIIYFFCFFTFLMFVTLFYLVIILVFVYRAPILIECQS